jgi:hypothetical protein
VSLPDAAIPAVAATGTPWEAAFESLPPAMIVRAFGIDYAHLRPPEGGDLYLTPHGWPVARQLLPAHWYGDRWYATGGVQLPGASGHVYHVRTRPVAGRSADLVVKFSRVAQEVAVVLDAAHPEDVSQEVLSEARFNSPMEEFGLVEELRRGDPSRPRSGVRAQRPLGIYAPPESFDLWELGRTACRLSPHLHLLAEDQEGAPRAIELDIKRIYVLLYGWIRGEDAEDCHRAGRITDADLRDLTPRVAQELERAGFHVLDNKPKHYILRPRPGGGVLRDRAGRPVYGLVDFEFLLRTPERQRRFESEQRERYWRLRAAEPPAATAPAPAAPAAGGTPVSVFGIGYLYQRLADGGRLWVRGADPALADYFVPDRWRRTPRVRLSTRSQVYRTRTRDNVVLVYRLSRVGVRPHADPLTDQGRRIRAHGHNSPFEEVLLAERLREMGVPTVVPRAIYRTAHTTVSARHLIDSRRFEDHAGLWTPDDPREPVLASGFDYYTIWDCFRGASPPGEGDGPGMRGVVDLDRAEDEGLLSPEECEATVRRSRERLVRRGLPAEGVEREDLVVRLAADGRVMRSAEGVEVILALDTRTAYEYGLVDEPTHRAIVERMDQRLRAVDFEKLDPNGRHLLLTMDPDGRFVRDAAGAIHATLCNFSLIRGLYRPPR